jgi:hypothetical protein
MEHPLALESAPEAGTGQRNTTMLALDGARWPAHSRSNASPGSYRLLGRAVAAVQSSQPILDVHASFQWANTYKPTGTVRDALAMGAALSQVQVLEALMHQGLHPSIVDMLELPPFEELAARYAILAAGALAREREVCPAASSSRDGMYACCCCTCAVPASV